MRPEPSLESAHAALEAGQPRLAAEIFCDLLPTETAAHGLAAALLRLGRAGDALQALEPWPPGARRALLTARAHGLTGHPDALGLATEARRLARLEGDGPALVAAATLLGELQLRSGQARDALHTLAEGLKVAELLNVPADPLLLTALARVQWRVGSPAKARRTAEKALARSAPGSPARVSALLALGRPDEARTEAERGELAAVYLE